MSKLSRLNSKQLQLIESLVDELLLLSSDTALDKQVVDCNSKSEEKERSKDLVQSNTDSSFISSNQVLLKVNDRVKMLNTRISGKTSDVGHVVKFTKKCVPVKLDRNGKTVLRSSKPLHYVQSR